MDETKFREWFKLCIGTTNKMIEARNLFEEYMSYCDKYEDVNLTKEQGELLKPYLDEMVDCLLYFMEG